MKCISKSKLRSISILMSCVLLIGCTSTNDIKELYTDKYDASDLVSQDNANSELASLCFQNICVADADLISAGFETDTSLFGSAAVFNVTGASAEYAYHVKDQMNPTSLTRILTAYVALKYGNLEDVITASSNCIVSESGVQSLGFAVGDSMTLEQALYALLLTSDNAVGIMIAEHISGSVEAFSALMNSEAMKLGATSSNFVNPHGLTAENHYLTVYDLYLIFNEAMKNQTFMQMIQTQTYEAAYTAADGSVKSITFENTFPFLAPGGTSVSLIPEGITVLGGKSGTTSAAGSCMVLVCQDTSSNLYIVIVMNAKDRTILSDQMVKLLSGIVK